MKIRKVGVLGAGLMGSGIAEVAAKSGYETVVREVNEELGRKGIARIEGSLAKAVEKGKLSTADRDAARGRLSATTDHGALADCDIIVEAIVENLELKKETYRELDRLCKPETIFCSNTSSLTITEMSAATKRADRFAGLHFFNPVPVMKLVEVVRGRETSDETATAITRLAEALGKTPAVANDVPGFVSNRILMPFINEAVWALHAGVAEAEAIDTIAKLGFAHPLGPLALADLIGLDTCVAIMEVLQDGLGDDRYAPCPLLREHVEAGRLGRKTGTGFYRYE